MAGRKKNKKPASEFIRKLEKLWAKDKFLCVGLDPDYEKIPNSIKGNVSDRIFKFNKAIIEATAQFVVAFKPNSAFYEAKGTPGLFALVQTVKYIKKNYPDIPVILDAKRADIGNTNNGYVTAAFDEIGVDAITVHPYLGREAIQPFLDRADKGIIVLVRTSNAGAGEFQDLKIGNKERLYITIAKKIAKEWNGNGNIAMVVGAPYPDEIKLIRKAVGDIPFLIPGLGKQGGDVEATVKAGMDSRTWGMIINSSRDILFASSGADFASAAGQKARELSEQINWARRPEMPKAKEVMPIGNKKAAKILADTNAILTNGHFVYVSGKHGDKYVNKDAIYPHTDAIRKLTAMWAKDFKNSGVEVVVGPAMGGVILSHDTASELSKILKKDIPGVYAEKTGDGGFNFTRGYDKFVKGKKVLVVEDVLTTGGSVKKVIDKVRETGGKVIGLAVIANRGNVQAKDVGVKKIDALINIRMEMMEQIDCTLCRDGVPVNTNVGKGKLFLAGKKIS